MAVGSPTVTLTISGSGFAPGATARWEGTPLSTTVVSATELRVVVGAERLVTAVTARMTVTNPGGLAAVPSNALPITVGDGGQRADAFEQVYLPLVRR